MANSRTPSPVRGLLFFSISLFLLLFMAFTFRGPMKMTGTVLNEVLFAMGLPILAAIFVERQPVKEVLSLRWLNVKGFLRSLLLGFVAVAFMQVMGLLTLATISALGGEMIEVYPELMQVPFLVALLVGAVVPAICEEVAFRGYIQWSLGPLGPRAAVIITGLLFGAMHLTLVRLIPLTLLGIVLASAVQRSGSIFPGMIAHFINNATAIVLSFLVVPNADVSAADTTSLSIPPLVGVALVLGWVLWAIVRSFNPGDLAGQPKVETRETTASAPPTSRHEVPSLIQMIFPLIPALVLYLWVVANELHIIFGLFG